MHKVLALLLIGLLHTPLLHAAPDDQTRYAHSLDLHDAWVGLGENIPFEAQWRSDGQFYYRKAVAGGYAFVIGNPESTQASGPAFDAERLADALSKATGIRYEPLRLPFRDFEFVHGATPDSWAIRFYLLPEYDRWGCELANHTCAEVVEKQRPRAFGVVRDMREPGDQAARRSPDGRWEVYAQGHNVALRRTGSRSGKPLTRDGSPDAFYDLETVAWSPDSHHFALYRVTPGEQRLITLVESAPKDQLQPRYHVQLYPKPGDAVDSEHPYLFDLTGKGHAIETDLFPNPYSLSPIQWRSDSAGFHFRYIERGFQTLRRISVSRADAKPRVSLQESASTFVDSWHLFDHMVDGLDDEIVWVSERDGWRHLYLFDAHGGKVASRITRGEWIVRDVVHVDDAARRIWFTASGMDTGQDPYQRQLMAVDFDGSNLQRLSAPGTDHNVSFSPDGRWYVDVHSAIDTVPISELRRADGGLVRVLEQGDAGRLLKTGWRPPETFTAPGRDGVTPIWGIVVRPRDHDPAKKYPVIENIYAGPHSAFVPKTFWPFDYRSGADRTIDLKALADLGFIVVMIDGMGTANRSKAFHDVAWKNLGDSGFPDRIAWHRALAARDPSYDISRGVGIYGVSAGGQSTLGALERHPDFYRVGVAVSGCYDNRLDKISWNEQWMGWPVDQSYAEASGVVNAHRMQGDLLLVVGELDSNVDPASTAQVANALIAAGKRFELINVPGGGHLLGRTSGPVDYVKSRMYDFFIRHLQGQPAAGG